MFFRFAEPLFLALLLLLPLLAWWRGRHGGQAALRFSSTTLAREAQLTRAAPGQWLLRLRWFALTACIVALARPQAGNQTEPLRSEGIDIMLTLDLSPSMWAHDFELDGQLIDRLSVVKKVIADFIERRPNDRLGFVVFAGEPYLVSPLTLNHNWLIERLQGLRIGQLDGRTAIGSALGVSIGHLADEDAESRVIILLTDGDNNAGPLDPVQAASLAAEYGIRIYSIGVGRTGLVPYPAQFDPNGQPVRNRDGQILMRQVTSVVDLVTLDKVANLTGGRYYHATATEQLENVYAEIDSLEKRSLDLQVRRLYRDLFWLPLGLALGLLSLEILLSQTVWRRIP